jgi:hypothetical protein
VGVSRTGTARAIPLALLLMRGERTGLEIAGRLRSPAAPTRTTTAQVGWRQLAAARPRAEPPACEMRRASCRALTRYLNTSPSAFPDTRRTARRPTPCLRASGAAPTVSRLWGNEEDVYDGCTPTHLLLILGLQPAELGSRGEVWEQRRATRGTPTGCAPAPPSLARRPLAGLTEPPCELRSR